MQNISKLGFKEDCAIWLRQSTCHIYMGGTILTCYFNELTGRLP